MVLGLRVIPKPNSEAAPKKQQGDVEHDKIEFVKEKRYALFIA